jgi:hypothetical protein
VPHFFKEVFSFLFLILILLLTHFFEQYTKYPLLNELKLGIFPHVGHFGILFKLFKI